MSHLDNRQPFLALAGNIGVGKTTMTNLLSAKLGWEPWFEPVINNPYLDDFYSDMERWSFHLQIYFLSKRFEAQRKILESPRPSIQDRTIYEDVEIFARTLHKQRFMTDREFDNYSSLFECMMEYLRPPDAIVYLRAPVKVLMDRIQSRGRESEKTIRIEYLTELNDAYDSWIDRARALTHVLVFETAEIDNEGAEALSDRIIATVRASSQLSFLPIA
ncbi:MAG: deoxynucleoside kinase [bacterium]|nr:deoxynucleoside kinase [bacterium]